MVEKQRSEHHLSGGERDAENSVSNGTRFLELIPGVRTQRQATLAATAFVFSDPLSIALLEKLDLLAPNDATVLIIGETGTGKELVSRYLHAQSRRKPGPFIAVNCGALTDSLAEAELFGHEKGVFTGATMERQGWFEAASGGTLLLDEVGELPLHLQVKLLRVLQEREVTRIGARRAIPIDVRLIAATNVDLHTAVAAKKFREDLYFRLNVASVTLPPLRDRPADIVPLAQHFLAVYKARFAKPGLDFAIGATDLLRRHSWPGNIRELENVVQNAVLLTQGPLIEGPDLELRRLAEPASSLSSPGGGKTSEAGLLEDFVGSLVEAQIARGEPRIFDRVRRAMVQSAFSLAAGNQVRAAASLGISRNELRTQLAHLGIIPARAKEPAGDPVKSAGRSASASRASMLRVGFQKFGALTILKTAQMLENRFAGKGVDISWTEYPAGPQLLEALRSGQIDFGTTGEAPPVFAQAEGASMLYVGHEPPAPSGEALLVPSDSSIRTVADLKGKSVALTKAANVHYFLVRALEANGLSLRDIEPVYFVPRPDITAFEALGADAWALWDPLLPAIQLTRPIRILLDGTGLVANRQFHLSSEKFARDSSDAVRIVLDEVRKAGEYAAGNPEKIAKSLSSATDMDPSALRIAVARMTYGTKPMDRHVVAEQQKIADRFYALGLLDRSIEVRNALWTP